MSKLIEIAKQTQSMNMLVDLTGVFEGIASMKIAKVKNQVLQSTKFFNDLWGIYVQLRVDSLFRFGRDKQSKVIAKELFIIITSEGGFSGDIDQKLVGLMLKDYSPAKNDIIVIGHHGAVQLRQKGIRFVKYYKLPAKDTDINTQPIINDIQGYKNTVVFYEEYTSLMNQSVKKIEIKTAVAEQGKKAEESESIISEENYIFEPSTFAVVEHLESSMLKIAISQLILESKLAQYASRFKAMSQSHRVADESLSNARLKLNRTKRSVKDERLKEMINGMRKRELGRQNGR